jgi:hypothetical protein
MIGLHFRLGNTSRAVSTWLLEGMAQVDFRARLATPLTEALTEFLGPRDEAADRVAVPAIPDRGDLQPTPAGELAGPHEAPAATDRTGRRARPRLGLAVHMRRSVAVGIALVAVTGGATASSLWLAPAGNRVFGYNPGLAASAPPAAQLGALGVLRRPQTDGERGPGVQAALADVNNFTTGIRSDYVRVLETTRDGAVVLVPVKRREAIGSQSAIDNALCVYYPSSGAGSKNNTRCWSTQQLLAGQAFAGGSDHEYGLAPDRVPSVLVALGPWKKSATVAENFFDVTLPSGSGTTSASAPVPISPTITFSQGAS